MRNIFAIVLVGSLVLSAWGCGGGAQRIDPHGPGTITTVGDIDIQDWFDMADQMLDSLYSSGVLERAPRQPAVLAVTQIVNDTTQRIRTPLLTDRINESLTNSGKVQVSARIGQDRDETTAQQSELEEFMGEKPAEIRQFDYTLSGRIIEQRARAGRTRQSSFVFTLRLNDPRTGTVVWSAQRTITKQGERAVIGM